MKGRREKGQYGYRNYHKRKQSIKVLFGAVMILIQLGARNFTDNEAVKNVLTLMAILSVLPTANVASPLLASWKYKTPSYEFYEKVKAWGKNGVIVYDLIIISKEQIMPMDALMVHPTGIFAYCSQARVDIKKAETYLKNTFKSQGIPSSVKVIKEEKEFLKQISSLKPDCQINDDKNFDPRINVLKNLSM